MWTKTAMKDKTRPCAVYIDVIPIYAVLPPGSPVRAQLASAVLEHVYKIRHGVEFNTTMAPLTCPPTAAPVAQSPGNKGVTNKAPPKAPVREQRRHLSQR